jgi:histidinol-phosphate/aromatic aminotransferase/cobyric acid decarboxylase-like protein
MALGQNEYYEQVLRVVMHLGDSELKAKRLCGQRWYEIDDLQDLDIAESIFSEIPEQQVEAITSRYGGYWRYPNLVDYCYLVNPYYPPQRQIDEMKASFERLLTQYPSGMRVNSLLGAKLFGIDQSYVAVGNGAAELIKSLTATMQGTVGVIRPTFEEYPNRLGKNQEVTFVPATDDLSYTVDDIMSFFGENPVDTLLLINPDNPTGNYLNHSSVEQLASWCEDRGVRLVLDESFVDFADEENPTFLSDELLEAYPSLVVVKSISKSYGVPGVRLGVIATADKELIAHIRADVSIWNINSFGEFWLQIAEKYQADYVAALGKLRVARKQMACLLREVPSLRVFDSQANYLLVELCGGMSAAELTKRLLVEDSILIKDLSKKIVRDGRQFVRLAIRTEEENERLVKAIRRVMG